MAADSSHPQVSVSQEHAGGAVRPRGLLVLDVDGVLFQGQLITSLSRRVGWRALLLTVWYAFLFESGRIDINTFINKTFGRLRGIAWDEVVRIFRRMALVANVRTTIEDYRGAGWHVLLLSSGVPNELMGELVERVGADAGAGIEIHTERGTLTGGVAGDLMLPEGKLRYVERVRTMLGIAWKDVIAVGDDRNNLDLMRRAGVGVGVRASLFVRREADWLIEGYDIEPLSALAASSDVAAAERLAGGRQVWHREIARKLVHLTGAATPWLFGVAPGATVILLIVAMSAYIFIEMCRINGFPVPGLYRIAALIIRRHERRHLALGPLTLALGVLVTFLCFPTHIAMPCILIAVVADSLAAVVGGRWGSVRWLHGTAAFFVGAALCAALYLPPGWALMAAGAGATIESLPSQDWDNFITPVGTAMALAALSAL